MKRGARGEIVGKRKEKINCFLLNDYISLLAIISLGTSRQNRKIQLMEIN